MPRAIFISYRREDSEGEAGRLFDDLVRSWGEDSVFMDVAGISPGLDFRKAIDDNVATCGVLLAIIGPAWTTIAHPSGERRLDDPGDFVRLEIASALRRQIPVIPVLVHDAKMPAAAQLPEDIKDLAFRNSAELSHARWNSDLELLTAALRRIVPPGPAVPARDLQAAAQPPAREPAPPKKSKAPVLAAALAVLAVVLGVALYAAAHRHKAGPNSNPGNTAAAPAGPAPAVEEETSPEPQPPAASTPAASAPSTSAPSAPAAAPVSAPVAAAASTPVSAPGSAASAGSPAWVQSMVGNWINQNPESDDGIKRLQIATRGGALAVHAWGACQPYDCDWGESLSHFDGYNESVAWGRVDPHHPKRTVGAALLPVDGGLRVTITNFFPKRPAITRQIRFVPAP